jgi:hypothetical protein
MNTRALITGIAALFLATGTAHSESDEPANFLLLEYECGAHILRVRWFPDVQRYTFEVSGSREAGFNFSERPLQIQWDNVHRTVRINGENCPMINDDKAYDAYVAARSKENHECGSAPRRRRKPR